MGFLNIVSSGLWCDSTTTSLLPKIFWSKFLASKNYRKQVLFDLRIVLLGLGRAQSTFRCITLNDDRFRHIIAS